MWVYAVMFMFWPVQLTYAIYAIFGKDIKPQRSQSLLTKKVDRQPDEDSDDGSDDGGNMWMFNSKRQKSPKNAMPLLFEDDD